MLSNRLINAILAFLAVLVGMVLLQLLLIFNVHAADRAVEIAKQSRDRIETSGNMLKESSQAMFTEFAERSGELQRLLDTRERLEQAGLLSRDTAEGRARRAHINARVISEVGRLKDVCDNHLDPLLTSLGAFDQAISESIVDTQATRSISDNHELKIKNYKKAELRRFNQAAEAAEELLNQIRNEQDPRIKRQLVDRYRRVKNRLRQIQQRRNLYENRLRIAAMNQVLSDKTREKIREHGDDIPKKFIAVISNLNNAFYKVVPVAETGGTGFADSLSGFGFSNLKKLSETLDIVSASTQKLDGVLNEMVNDVLKGLDGIQHVEGETFNAEVMSYEKEMEFIGKERAAWSEG